MSKPTSPRPMIYVPVSNAVERMLDPDALAFEPRATQVGVCLLAPRTLSLADLVDACDVWPALLHRGGVSRIAVVLGVETFLYAHRVVAGCEARFRMHGVAIAYFHEGHLETDQVRAWFDRRAPRRRVTTDVLVSLCQRYQTRSDIRGARAALCLAQDLGRKDEELTPAA